MSARRIFVSAEMCLTDDVAYPPFVFRCRFDMKGNVMTDMTLPRPAEVPPLDFDTLAAKLKEEEVTIPQSMAVAY